MGDQKKPSWASIVLKSTAERSIGDGSQRNNFGGRSAPDNQSGLPSPAAGSRPSVLNNGVPTVSALNRDALPTINSRTFSRHYQNISPAPNQGRENVRSGPCQQAPIGHRPMQNYQCHGSSAVGDGHLGGAPLQHEHRRSEGRNLQARTRNGLYSQAGSGSTTGHSTSLGQSNAPRSTPHEFSQSRRCRSHEGHAMSHFNITTSDHGLGYSPRNLSDSAHSAHCHEFRASNPYNMASFHRSLQQPPPTYNISYNISVQQPCRHWPIQQQSSNPFSSLFPSVAVQPSFSQPNQHWEYQHAATPFVDFRNPCYFQYEGSGEMHYQRLWSLTSNPSDQMINQPGNSYQLYPSAPPHSYYPSVGASNNAGNTTSYEPLYHSSVWGLPQVSDNSWYSGSLFSQYPGGTDHPWDLSAYVGYNHGEYGSNSFSNSPVPLAQEVHGTQPDNPAQQEASNQQDVGAERRPSVNDEGLNENVTKKNKEVLKENNEDRGKTKKDRNNNYQRNSSSKDDDN